MVDIRQEQDNARRLNLARASGQRQQQYRQPQTTRRIVSSLSKLSPSGVGGFMGKKVAEKVFGRRRASKVLGWIIGSVGCGCLVAIIFVLLPILLLVVLGCGPLRLC